MRKYDNDNFDGNGNDNNDFKDFTNDLTSAIVHNCFKIVSIGLHHAEQSMTTIMMMMMMMITIMVMTMMMMLTMLTMLT